MNTATETSWKYTGDINLEYGGMFYKGELSDEYADVIRVSDLDSGIGFSGAVLVEERTAIWSTKPGDCHYKDTQQALECVGLDKNPEECTIHELVDAVMAYGLHDPATNYQRQVSWTFQTDDDGPMEFDGWKADGKKSIEEIRAWIESDLMT